MTGIFSEYFRNQRKFNMIFKNLDFFCSQSRNLEFSKNNLFETVKSILTFHVIYLVAMRPTQKYERTVDF